MDVAVGLFLGKKKGGGLGEGRLKIPPDRRLADDGKRWYSDGRCIMGPVGFLF